MFEIIKNVFGTLKRKRSSYTKLWNILRDRWNGIDREVVKETNRRDAKISGNNYINGEIRLKMLVPNINSKYIFPRTRCVYFSNKITSVDKT